ncbi:helix-turn-helix domain-containing protein [Roseovarius aestuarii]|uniref:Transcriptional repressor DicA n=1 Tax=Roseovarius aestuarii TaxID=475083 RepID=A0A1X7BRE3_9RHOB|nr:helix-turn-helix domain-containing protein [Roseovarius aestuarii]SMC12202.1 transcriptional repressor DicA [Roseovarius aestuarii]
MNAESKEHWFDPQATTFGDRVAGAREQAGMTQADLSKRLGVKVKTLKSWEDDLSEPRANKLSMMAGLLNVSLSWLLTGEGDGPAAPGDGGWLSQDAVGMLAELQDVRVQLATSSRRLARLEENLRGALKAEPVD